MQHEIIFKKNIIGGFNKKQVTQCFLQLKSESNHTVSSEDISDAKNAIESLKSTLSNKIDLIQMFQRQIEALNTTDEEDRITVAKSLSEAEKNIMHAKSVAEEIKQKTKKKINSNSVQIERMLSKSKIIHQECERIKDKLTQMLINLAEIQITAEKVKCDNHLNNSQPEAKHEAVNSYKNASVEDIVQNTDISPEEESVNILEETQESLNTIDNFFAELYKMTNGKLFEPRPLPKSDEDDNFEYEY